MRTLDLRYSEQHKIDNSMTISFTENNKQQFNPVNNFGFNTIQVQRHRS